MIRKFPCYCNLGEHDSKAILLIKEASTKKACLKNGFLIVLENLASFTCFQFNIN